MTPDRCLASFALAAAAALAAPAQQFVRLPTAASVVVAVTFGRGLADDPPARWGAARLVAECRLARARADLPRGAASGLRVTEDATIVFAQVPAADAAAAIAFAAAVAGDGGGLDDDALRLARARVALAADDDEWRFPGSVLQSRARAALFADGRARPLSGSAAALSALPLAELRDLLRHPAPLAIAAFGAVSAELQRALLALVPAAAPPHRAAMPAPPRQVAGDGAEPPTEILHPLVDAPFVGFAFPAPAPAQWPAFAVGIEVAKLRAAAWLPARPEQLRARAPVVAWSWLDGDPVVVFTARARGAGRADATLRKVAGFVANLGTAPPTAAELDSAKATLQSEIAPLPWTAAQQHAFAANDAALVGRVVQALLAQARGVDRAGIAAVDGGAVAESLRATLAPDRCHRAVLRPTAAGAGGPVR
ncbi:MAG: hypothetical protein U1E73_13535 [Planctomycetota bacterium]